MRKKSIYIFLLFALPVLVSSACQSGGSRSGTGNTGSQNHVLVEYACSWDGYANDICFDDEGNFYIAGRFTEAADFDPDSGIVNKSPAGGSETESDAYLSKFDSDGNLIWNLTWGGQASDSCDHVAIDPDGNVCVMGAFSDSVDFDPGTNTVIRTTGRVLGSTYVAKFNSNGGFLHVIDMGNSFMTQFKDFMMDTNGQMYLVGVFGRPYDFDPGEGDHTIVPHETNDAFILVLNNDGEFLWVKTYGTDEREEEAKGVAVDESGNIYVTGQIKSNLAPNMPGLNYSLNLHTYAYLTKMDPGGDMLWTKTWGGLDFANWGSDIVLDNNERIYVFGMFIRKVDFNPGFVVDERTSNDRVNYFISRFDIDGKFTGAVTLAIKSGKAQTPPVIDPDGNIYFGGNYVGSVDFDTGPGEDIRQVIAPPGVESSFDGIYVTRFNPSGEFQWVQTWDDALTEKYLWKTAVDSDGKIYLLGGFRGKFDFDPGPDELILESEGLQIDTFLVKLSQAD